VNLTKSTTDNETFQPVKYTTAAGASRCSVYVTGNGSRWSLAFNKTASAGNYGGITTLTDSGYCKSIGNTFFNQIPGGKHLFNVYYDGAFSYSPTSGSYTFADSAGKSFSQVRQSSVIAGLSFDMDYTIQGSGKMFVRVKATNSGAAVSGKTLRFFVTRSETNTGTIRIRARDSTNANQCSYLLYSNDSASQFDLLLAPFQNWVAATGFYSSASSGYAGYESNNWSLGANQTEEWNFMVDYSHKYWDDSTGVGKYAASYRNPDSMKFISGTPLLEKSWEHKLNGHWKLDEVSGASAIDNSGMGNTMSISGGTTSWVAGKWGGGLSVNGTTVSAGDKSSLSGISGDGFTVMAWIKPTNAISSGSVIIGKHNGSLGYKLTGNGSGQLTLTVDGNASAHGKSTSIGTGTWHHVAAKYYPGTQAKFFIDGNVDSTCSASGTTVTTNAAAVLIGSGYVGEIDDVRYYNEYLDDRDIRAIYKRSFRGGEGAYHLRADDNNAVHFYINGSMYNRRFPVLIIDNYWASSVPAAGCVTYNGIALTENTDYFAKKRADYSQLVIGLNKIITHDSALIYIDDNNSDGSRAVTSMRKMVWGKYTTNYVEGNRDWFWCKNFTSNSFGASGSNEYYFAWKFDSAKAYNSKSRGGELYRFKSSNISPYFRPDTSADSSLMPTSAVSDMTPLGGQLFWYNPTDTLPSTLTASVPTYTVVESSDVRIVLQLNERALYRIGGGTAAAASMTTRWTVYPTGQVFRWDSLSSLTAPGKVYSGVFQRYVAAPTFKSRRPRMRSSIWKAGTIHDNVMAFLGFRYGVAQTASSYPWTGAAATDTIADGSLASTRTGQWFHNTPNPTGTPWSNAPLSMAFYYDFQRDNLADSIFCDSVSNGVQCMSVPNIAVGAALGMTLGTLLSGGLATQGDLNADGFNESEGAYRIQASGNAVLFTLPARTDTCRFYPVFRISSYTATQKPQYFYCYRGFHGTGPDTLSLLEGYNYNMYLNRSAQELVVQIDSVFCDSAIFYISPDRTLAVELTEFKAEGGDGCDTVRWHTESESENLGYYLYRRIRPSFLDSISKAIAGIIDEGELDNAGLLAKRKIISISDTNWFKLNDQIIQSLSGGASAGPLDYKHIDSRNIYNEVVYEYRLESVSYKNEKEGFGPAWAKPMAMMPKMFGLFANYPNPFRSVTNIRFDVPAKALVSLTVFDLRGRMVRQVVRAQYAAGRHMVLWDGRDGNGREAAAGPYLYRLSSGKYSKVKMMMLVR
jgi:hypothetical protein